MTPPPPPSAWRSFVAGLVRPSYGSAGILLAVTMVLFLVPEQGFLSVTRLFTTYFPVLYGPESRFETSANAVRLSQSTDPRPQVFILGASTAREALSGDGDLGRRLKARTGLDIQVTSLTTPGMVLWEYAAYLEQLNDALSGVAVLFVSPGRLSRDIRLLRTMAETPPMGFHAPRLEAEARLAGIEPRRRSGIYMLDFTGFVLASYRAMRRRIAMAILVSPSLSDLAAFLSGKTKGWQERQGRHFFVGDKPIKPREWATHTKGISQRIRNYDRNLEANLAVLARVIDTRTAKPNLSVVLVEDPVNPRIIDEVYGPAFYAEHRETMRAFAQKQGVPYLYLADEARLAPADFVDWGHINKPAAQRRFTAALATRLSAEFDRRKTDRNSQ